MKFGAPKVIFFYSYCRDIEPFASRGETVKLEKRHCKKKHSIRPHHVVGAAFSPMMRVGLALSFFTPITGSARITEMTANSAK